MRHQDQHDPGARPGPARGAGRRPCPLPPCRHPDLHRRPPRRPAGRALGADGPINRAAFDAWVETQLAPTLRKGDVVILDNLAVHRSPRAEALLREKGACFLFLPPYSPDLNPIEMAFAKLKAHLRRIGARTLDALWRAIGEVCDLFTPDE